MCAYLVFIYPFLVLLSAVYVAEHAHEQVHLLVVRPLLNHKLGSCDEFQEITSAGRF